ncbi:putative phospholipase/Carboxylesterase [Lyophyllum shimeji]|uniref:Acyl-protein thioesterase 1 n=1 Tax=Lyophyllum shimeji TaxID=47721 RepID=A0A9P3PEI5_LYOSH|nr:putative phospholipase/Carboxylesterase [Lyophyllum shimeji]
MAATAPLKFLSVSPIGKHTATVIFIHGLGDTGHGWKPVADMFRNEPGLRHIKWILPHSPTRSVKANMGIEMPSWFDIYSFGFETDEDESGMLESAGRINQLISAEVESGTDPSRILLGGFSQGAAMSLLTGLTGDRKLAGIAALSGWLPMRHKFKTIASPHAAGTPIFWGHGSNDPLVRIQISKESIDILTNSMGLPRLTTPDEFRGLYYKVYGGMGHTTNEEELEDLKSYIKKVLPEVAS